MFIRPLRVALRRFSGRRVECANVAKGAKGGRTCVSVSENAILGVMKRVMMWCTLVFWASSVSAEAQTEAGAAPVSAPDAPQDVQSEVAGAAKPETITPAFPSFPSSQRPPPRRPQLPSTRWEHKEGNAVWTRAALSALKGHGKPLVDLVPADIGNWCPAYPQAEAADRRAFWVGFLSALAKHESTYRATAVGGGGRWYGLLQILPGTARGYKCKVGTGRALKNGAANLSCAIRIMAVTVPRDGVIYGRGGRGVAADWGPMRSKAKRRDMSGWLRQQRYCQSTSTLRPKLRP